MTTLYTITLSDGNVIGIYAKSETEARRKALEFCGIDVDEEYTK